jgi:16S rRNA (uracil1498-N3)-methyltransferase
MPDARRRFFVDPGAITGTNVKLKGDIAHRLARVLRLHRDDHVLLASGGPVEHLVRLETVTPAAVTGVVVSEQSAPAEATTEVTLYLSLIRPNRFDFALEKCTEIGVAAFVPVISARSQFHDEAKAARADRWQSVIVEAAEQCGRGRLPVVSKPMQFEEAIRTAPGLKLVPWEEERTQKLSDTLRALKKKPVAVSIFIGPEGGYTPEEISLAGNAQATLVTLGRRVLRTETAAVVASGIVLHELDKL